MTKTSSILLGIHLIVAALLTWLWKLICPQMTIEGSSWLARKVPESGGWHTVNPYFFCDPIVFATGVLVIWGITLGIYFLISGYMTADTSSSVG